MRCALMITLCWLGACAMPTAAEPNDLPPLPASAKLALEENFDGDTLDRDVWYTPRNKWGAGNHGVIPENVRIERDTVDDREQNVLVCYARGDQYTGPLVGLYGKSTRLGGIAVTHRFFASGRYQIRMKVGQSASYEGGPEQPTEPRGAVPAIWTYAYRFVRVDDEHKDQFVDAEPLYNPHMPAYGIASNEYWSEIDFPELGKQGDFTKGLFNTFCQNRYDWRTFPVPDVTDGKYHTYTMQWRTTLKPLPQVRDEYVVEHEGFYWVHDKSIPFDQYLGNPLKRLGDDEYAVHWGQHVEHFVDGQRVGENTKHIPAMAAQLTLGVWLPEWGGPAPWKTSRVSFASVKVWQFDDPGDVRGILTRSLRDNFDKSGKPLSN